MVRLSLPAYVAVAVLISMAQVTGCDDGYGGPASLLWAKNAGSWCSDLAVLSEDTFVITGHFQDTVMFGAGEANETSLTAASSEMEIYIARYDSSGGLLWARSAGGVDPDVGSGVAILPDDSVVVTGVFSGTATFGAGELNETDLVSVGGSDVFVALYDIDGMLVWATAAGGTSQDGGEAVAALSDGSVVVTGGFYDQATFGAGESGETTLVSAWSNDIFVARYNNDGTLDWAKRAGGATNANRGTDVAALSDDSAVVTGYFQGTATFGQGEPNETVLTESGGAWGAFLARYNTDGTLAWVKQAAGPDLTIGNTVAVLADDAVVMAGYFADTVTIGSGEAHETSLVSAGGCDIYVARYESDGMLTWAKRAGGDWEDVNRPEDAAYAVAPVADGSVLVTGNFEGVATFGPGEERETSLTSEGGRNVFVVRYNPDGSLLWAKRAGATVAARGTGAGALSDGSLVVTGWFGGTATFGSGEPNATTLSSAYGGGFVARYDYRNTVSPFGGGCVPCPEREGAHTRGAACALLLLAMCALTILMRRAFPSTKAHV